MIGDPKTVFEPYPSPKSSPLGPQKAKNDTKIKSKSNVGIEGTIRNKSIPNLFCHFWHRQPWNMLNPIF